MQNFSENLGKKGILFSSEKEHRYRIKVVVVRNWLAHFKINLECVYVNGKTR